MAGSKVSNQTTNGATMIYEFGELRFDGVSGQLTSLDGQSVSSLSPQPAALLLLLLEHAGKLVTHETIRGRLWPDSQVEYDQGVHFCIRQIRTALADSAKSPQFIETLAKRGYRFIAPARRITDPQSIPKSAHLVNSKIAKAVGVLLLVVASTIGYLSLKPNNDSIQPPIPIAIMPMNYSTDENISQSTKALAMHLVADLTKDIRLSVVGPTTTVQFSNEIELMKTTAGISVTYIINGRFVQQDEDVRLLAELIRTSDGAHIWTHWFELPLDPAGVSLIIQAAVKESILTDPLTVIESD
ncbi:MAG: DNA-binding winged helix-turn-helix (wHTH) protein/TolB-like protein [Candidatus Krumholzibacteriia bacterium]|jgi:DNA-binding winged helix-turn-helix (wHTH) protein/TolB-like protein